MIVHRLKLATVALFRQACHPVSLGAPARVNPPKASGSSSPFPRLSSDSTTYVGLCLAVILTILYPTYFQMRQMGACRDVLCITEPFIPIESCHMRLG